MAKFRVETQLAIDKASTAAAKTSMEGLTKAATQLGAVLVGEKAFVAPFKAMKSVIEDAITASDKATAAQERIREAAKSVYKVIGDELTPGMNQLAESIQKALTNPEVQRGLATAGQLLSVMATGVSAVVDEIAGFVGSPAFSSWLQFLYGVDLNSDTMKAYREQGKAVDDITAAVSKWAKGVAEQQKAEEKAAEARKKAHDAHLKALESILDKVNPIAKAERETWEQILTLNQAFKAGEIDVNTYQQALTFLTRELNNVKAAAELTAATIASIEMPSRIEGVGEIGQNPFAGGSMTVGQSPYVEEMMRAQETFSTNLQQGMGDAVASFAREFIETGEFNIERLGDMLLDVLLSAAQQYFATMVANQAKLKMEGGTSGTGGGMSGMGWFAVAAIAIEAYAAHIAKSDKKDYTDLGADRTVGISGGNVTSSIGLELDAGFKDQLLEAMNAYLEAFREVTGGVITGLGDIMVDVRQDGKEWKAQFNGEIIGYFDSLEGAMMAGIQAAFKAEEFAGALDPILRQVVENYQGDAKEFLSAIQRVGSILDEISGLSEIEVALRDLPQKSAALANELQGLGVAAGDAAVLAAKWNATQLQNLRDQITGHQQSEAEMLAQRQREAEMFNAQLALDKAKNDAEILNLQNQIAIENAKVDVLNAANQAQLAILNASLAAYQQIAAIYSSIAPIAMGEIRIPRAGRGGGHGGGSTTPTGPSAEDIAAQLAADTAAFWADIAAGWRSAMGGVTAQFLELNQWYEEQAARARELGIPLEELNALYEQQLLNLANDTLAGLGLQSVTTTNQFLALQESLKYLVEWGAITEDQMRELGDSMYISLVDSLLQYVDNEDVRRQLEDLRFRMEMANYQLQFQMLLQLKLLTQAEIDIINGLLGSIQDAYDDGQLQFQLPRPRPQQTHTQTNGQSAADAARAEAERALRAALDRLRNAVEGLQEFQESLLLSNVTPLTTSQQFEEAQRQYAELLAAAQGGDVGAMEQLAGAAQTYLELAAQMYGTSGAGYAAIFDAVSQQVAAIAAMGQHLLDSVPPQMAGTEDRLDTIAEILRAMAGLGLGSGGNGNGTGTGQNPNPWHTGYIYFGPVHGWHPRGWTPPATTPTATASLGSHGNLSLGNFTPPGQIVTVSAPSLLAEIRNLVDVQKEATLEAKNDRMKKPVASWSHYGKPIGNRRSG